MPEVEAGTYRRMQCRWRNQPIRRQHYVVGCKTGMSRSPSSLRSLHLVLVDLLVPALVLSIAAENGRGQPVRSRLSRDQNSTVVALFFGPIGLTVVLGTKLELPPAGQRSVRRDCRTEIEARARPLALDLIN